MLGDGEVCTETGTLDDVLYVLVGDGDREGDDGSDGAAFWIRRRW